MKIQDILSEAIKAPNTSDFPKAMAIVRQRLKDRTRPIERIELALAALDEAMNDGEIVSNKVDEIKRGINELVDQVSEGLSDKYWYAGKYESLPEELRWIYPPKTARELPGFIKKLKKISDVNNPAYKECMELANELLPLADAIEWIKIHTVKLAAKRAEKKEQAAAVENEYKKKWTDHKDVQKVVALLKQTASEIEIKIYTGQLDILLGIVKAYKEAIVKEKTSDPYKIYAQMPWQRMIIGKIVERFKDEFIIVKDWKDTLEKEAKRTAAEIVDHFVYKNSGKLSYLIYTKNNLTSVEIKNVKLGRGAVECDVYCKFKDGSEFIANSSVVYTYSSLGNLFYRYPTTFRNVKLPGGSKLTGPSEQKMDEIFAVAK